MKFNCGEQEQEYICDLNISEQICDVSICELFCELFANRELFAEHCPKGSPDEAQKGHSKAAKRIPEGRPKDAPRTLKAHPIDP